MLDNYSLWEQHEREQHEKLSRRPICHECEEHIQEEYGWVINGEWICESCLKAQRINIEEWILEKEI